MICHISTVRITAVSGSNFKPEVRGTRCADRGIWEPHVLFDFDICLYSF